jgi:hypothetical protein
MTVDLDMVAYPNTVELHASRRKYLGLLLIAGVFAFFAVASLEVGYWWSWPATVLFGMAMLVFLGGLIRPARLTVSAAGLSTWTLGRTWSVAWSEVDNFATMTLTSSGVRTNTIATFDANIGSGRSSRLSAWLNERMGGRNSTLSDTYGHKPSDLVEFLHRYRQAALNA